MTNEQFYRRLRRLRAPVKTWRVHQSGNIRTLGNHCPVTAVCAAMTGEKFDNKEYVAAGRALGLRPVVAVAIAEAADAHDDDLPRYCSPVVVRHRASIKKALAL